MAKVIVLLASGFLFMFVGAILVYCVIMVGIFKMWQVMWEGIGGRRSGPDRTSRW